MSQFVEIANDVVSPTNRHQPPQATVWVPVVVWGIVIFMMSTSVFSSLNTSRFIEPMLRWMFPMASAATISVLHALTRKTAHFVEYGVLFWLLVRGPMAGRPYTAFALCVVYAFFDEGHQMFVESRTPSLYDVALDSTGALFSRFLNLAVAELA
jgi:VanZ family protein